MPFIAMPIAVRLPDVGGEAFGLVGHRGHGPRVEFAGSLQVSRQPGQRVPRLLTATSSASR
jgi:hypothetical protein